jgi:hypothetical protein
VGKKLAYFNTVAKLSDIIVSIKKQFLFDEDRRIALVALEKEQAFFHELKGASLP